MHQAMPGTLGVHQSILSDANDEKISITSLPGIESTPHPLSSSLQVLFSLCESRFQLKVE
jgi:hypothetical protein